MMLDTSRIRRSGLSRGLVLVGTTVGIGAGMQTVHQTSGQPSPSPRGAMISVLGSAKPNPQLGDEARTFDRFVGAWDAEFGFYRDGSLHYKKGELYFGWIMDGRAIQDLWIGYPTGSQKERTIGTTIRFFDTAIRKWRVVFVGPQSNYMVTMQGGLEGDRIVLRGVDSDSLPIRWTFSELEPNSFHWQGEKSHDGGKSWTLEEDHRMRRRAAQEGGGRGDE
jgi:hypothetical protein